MSRKFKDYVLQPQDLERYWALVDRRGPDECWPWLGRTTSDGYGVFTLCLLNCRAHRFAHFVEHGEWPVHLSCHTCDNPPCQNPGHLFDGTNLQNLRDMAKKGRSTRGERSHMAKLTARDVAIIRVLLGIGCEQKEIAARYQMGTSSIFKIAHGETWAHVDAWSGIETRDGLRIEGSPRHGMHVSRDGKVLASYYHGPESADVLEALDRYRREAVEARRAMARE